MTCPLVIIFHDNRNLICCKPYMHTEVHAFPFSCLLKYVVLVLYMLIIAVYGVLNERILRVAKKIIVVLVTIFHISSLLFWYDLSS
jgi:hypothetical protein